MAFIDKVRNLVAQSAAAEGDPWRFRLERVRGQIGDDGVERITTQALLDALEVPPRSRGAGAYRRLAKVMIEIGWSPLRVRGLTRGGYLEQCRGYCRNHPSNHPTRSQSAIEANAQSTGAHDDHT